MDNTASFGYWLRRRRRALDLTQEALAQRVGCAVVTIGKFERDELRPSRQIAERLADCLAIPAAECPLFVKAARAELRVDHLSNPVDQVDVAPKQAIAGDVRPTNLAIQPTPLIGRIREVAIVCDMLRKPDVRLLTLTGAPGIGKTRLSLQAAAELLDLFTDGVFVVALGIVSDPGSVPIAIALALGVRDLDQRPTLDRLIDVLRTKQMLLVLDNFEHVLDAARTIATLLATIPGLKILITSRAALRISGEHEYGVPPLSLPPIDKTTEISEIRGEVDVTTSQPSGNSLLSVPELAQWPAIALFIARARAVKPNFALTAANAAAVAAICSRLDGLPLAIELAAARSKLFPPQIMLQRLEHRFAVLTDGPRDLPTRQQTLYNALTWSYDLLSSTDQRLFAHLAVFVGSFNLQAAEVVCRTVEDHTEPVLQGITTLVDHSLLYQDLETDEEPRFAMLETVRAYAQDWFAADPNAELTRRLHATYFLEIAEAAEQQWNGGEQTSSVKRLKQEQDNLHAAIEWALERGEVEIALRLTGALGWFWDIHGHLNEGRAWLAKALALSDSASPIARARALVSAGLLAADQNDTDTAQLCLMEALALFQTVGDLTGAAFTLCSLGRVQRIEGNYIAAQEHLAKGLALARQAGDARTAAYARYNLGRVTYQLGDYDAAHALFAEGLAYYQEAHDTWGAALSHCNLGRVAYRQGNYAIAEEHLNRSLASFLAIGDIWGIAVAHCKLGWSMLRRGDPAAAQAQFAQSFPLVQKAGYREGIADVLAGQAAVACKQGDRGQAARLLGVAGAIQDELGGTSNTIDQDDIDRVAAELRQWLDETTFVMEWERGRLHAAWLESVRTVDGFAMPHQYVTHR